MFDGNLALDGIDCDLRYKELQDPTFIFKGEAIKMLFNEAISKIEKVANLAGKAQISL